MKLNKFNKVAETTSTYPYSPVKRSVFSPEEKDTKAQGKGVSLPEKPKILSSKLINIQRKKGK